MDVSGGGDDSFALAIGHIEDNIGILDCVLERRPPLSPEGTIAEFCDTLKSYRIHRIVGDAYSGEFVRELFRKNGVEYKLNDELADKKTCTSQYFASFLPILNSKRCELLDNKRLVQQLASLERRPSRSGGRDIIGHPPGGHDDVACVAAGLMSRLLGKRGPMVITESNLQAASRPGPHTWRNTSRLARFGGLRMPPPRALGGFTGSFSDMASPRSAPPAPAVPSNAFGSVSYSDNYGNK